MKGTYFFHKMKIQTKQIFKSNLKLIQSGEKIRTKINY